MSIGESAQQQDQEMKEEGKGEVDAPQKEQEEKKTLEEVNE